MLPRTRVRSLAAHALLLCALLVVLAPVIVFLHEVNEHGIEDESHCRCLACHSTSHTPMELGAGPSKLGADTEVDSDWAPVLQIGPALMVCRSTLGRSPPAC